MSLERSPQCFVRLRRIEDRFGNAALILNGQADNRGFFNRPVRRFPGGINDELADTAALNFGGAFHDGEGVGTDARFDTGSAVGPLGHHMSLLQNYRAVGTARRAGTLCEARQDSACLLLAAAAICGGISGRATAMFQPGSDLIVPAVPAGSGIT